MEPTVQLGGVRLMADMDHVSCSSAVDLVIN